MKTTSPLTSAHNKVLNPAIPADVRASFADAARLTPMLAGASRVAGNLLTVRGAERDIEVRAPASFLAQVFGLCDGTRTVEEVLHALPPGIHRGEFGEFIDFLLESNALIDANLATAHAARYAFQASPFGLSADSAITDQICRRFTWNAAGAKAVLPKAAKKVTAAPLMDLFSDRVSTYTFAEKALAEQDLLSLLWSVAGVVRVKHARVGYVTPQHTIASAGGMQLLQVYVALQVQVGTYEPGVYRVRYPHEKLVDLEWLGDAQGLIPRAFGKPWELTFAAGAIFLAADAQVAAMRYRNRALQYLFMEAGAALHNAGLSAPRLGMGFATIGGYYEKTISRMCRLQDELVLGAAIFGAKPTAEQVKWIERSANLDFAWVDGESARFTMPFHLARAKVITTDDTRPHTWGRDTNPWLAYRKAAAEAVEREGFREPRRLTTGTLASVKGAVDPRAFVRYSDKQYSTPGFPYAPFDESASCLWTDAVDLASGQSVRILAELVFSRAGLDRFQPSRRAPFSQVTSSGCAASTSPEDAARRALLEVVERDAFMRHWLSQTPGAMVPASRLSVEMRARIRALEDAGCRIAVQKLESPWAHVCMVSAQHDHMHFTTMGTSAHQDFMTALGGALDETEARVYAWIHGHHPQIRNASDVVSTEHHFELYGLKRFFHRADKVLFPADTKALSRLSPLKFNNLGELVQRFSDRGIHSVMVDITPELSWIDQGRTRLSVVKALVPGLLPISFGYGQEPVGMVPKIHPGSRFPHPFP